MSAAVQLRSPPQALCAQLRWTVEKPSYSVLLVVEAVKSITMFSMVCPFVNRFFHNRSPYSAVKEGKWLFQKLILSLCRHFLRP